MAGGLLAESGGGGIEWGPARVVWRRPLPVSVYVCDVCERVGGRIIEGKKKKPASNVFLPEAASWMTRSDDDGGLFCLLDLPQCTLTIQRTQNHSLLHTWTSSS